MQRQRIVFDQTSDVPVMLLLTSSHVSFSSSTRTLISSGIAMAGWVSFSWMAT